ncbi:MAG: tRNA adenosine(34) deaminase TadA [Candidatus Marinimicrobia bacterium]|nr:tRNA adenosine(34) deaminase TadA [Candidatus Neomarinimicrobiota bacterium]
MKFALKEAQQALSENEIPVGAIIVLNDEIIGKGHNQREGLHDPTAHAEMIAISSAAETIGDWRLENCSLYVTLEPCPMCTGALLNARIPKLYFGAYDDEAGMCGSRDNLCQQNLLNHNVTFRGGILRSACQLLLDDFFDKIRKKNKLTRFFILY